MGRYEIMEINNEKLSLGDFPLAVNRYVINNDRLGDKLFLQIRFENIGTREISGFTIEISCSENGNTNNLCFDHLYSKLHFNPGEFFGTDEYIPLPDRQHTNIHIRCKTITFAD